LLPQKRILINSTTFLITCIKEEWKNGSKHSRYIKTKLYKEKAERTGQDGANNPPGTKIFFQGHIPEGYPDRLIQERMRIHWYLTVKLKTNGIPFKAEFELPVYSVTEKALIDYYSL